MWKRFKLVLDCISPRSRQLLEVIAVDQGREVVQGEKRGLEACMPASRFDQDWKQNPIYQQLQIKSRSIFKNCEINLIFISRWHIEQ